MNALEKLQIKPVLFTLLLGALLLLYGTLLANLILANDARLYLSPASGTQYVGANFSVAVLVNSGSHSTNAYKAVVQFPTALLSVTSVSVAGSICTLQVTGSPGYSNSAGTATFECGHQGSFSGSSGRIGTINFSVKAAGTANLSFSTAQVKAADGSGTEVLGSTGGATFNLQPAPVGAPAVSSPTHQDQNSWYPAREVELSWTTPAESNGFSYVFNDQLGTTPDDVSEGIATSGSFTARSDGIYYFHIKARGASGWGPTTHYKIQADITPPETFTTSSNPEAGNVTAAPLIQAQVTDRTSGIDHYELSFDGGAFEKVSVPYQFETIPEGVHTITIRAADRAGNYTDSSLTLNVADVEEPVITRPPDGSFLPLLESLVIEGTAPPGWVDLYLNDTFLVRIESSSNFQYTYPEFLRPGTYQITAVATNKNGIQSSAVKVTFTVDPRAVTLFGMTFPGWAVYTFLIGLVIILIILVIRFLRRQRKFDEHVIADVEKVEKEVERTADQVEKDLDQAVEEVLKGGDEARLRQMEHELGRKIEEAEGKAKKDLENTLEKIKNHHSRRRNKFGIPRLINLLQRKKKEEKSDETGGKNAS